MNIQSSYLHEAFDPNKLRVLITRVSVLLKAGDIDYDAIAFRGTSGAALAFPLSVRLRKPLIHVRKCLGHTRMIVEGDYGAKRYIIVDDFMDTGRTLRTIKKRINEAYSRSRLDEPTCVAVVLYVPSREYGFEEKQALIHNIFEQAQLICAGD